MSFCHASGTYFLDVSVSLSINSAQTEISKQLQGGLSCNLVQIFMPLWGWTVVFLVKTLHFPFTYNQLKISYIYTLYTFLQSHVSAHLMVQYWHFDLCFWSPPTPQGNIWLNAPLCSNSHFSWIQVMCTCVRRLITDKMLHTTHMFCSFCACFITKYVVWKNWKKLIQQFNL